MIWLLLNLAYMYIGKLQSRAFVPHGTSIAQCKEAILTDIKRSLRWVYLEESVKTVKHDVRRDL